jgi:hypothetical protein
LTTNHCGGSEVLNDVSSTLLQAVLGLLEGTEAAWLKEMVGCVININVPAGPLHAIKGLHLAHQVSIHCDHFFLAVDLRGVRDVEDTRSP